MKHTATPLAHVHTKKHNPPPQEKLTQSTIILLLPRLRRDMNIHKLAHRLLQPPVAIIVVRARRLGLQPQRLGIRNLRQISRLGVDDFRFLALELAETQRRVLLEDFMSVQVVEGFCGVCAGDLGEDDGAARVGVDEVAQVVDFVVDDCPEVFFSVVLWSCQWMMRFCVVSR